MSLDPVYQWMDSTPLSRYLQNTTYPFAVSELIHLLGITMLLGAVLTVCFRLLGFGIRQPASAIHQGLWKWTWTGLAVVVATGAVMVVGEPVKLSRNEMWGYKVWLLAFGLALHFFGYLTLLRPGRAEVRPLLAKALAVLILACWALVGVSGRLIGFV
jgi:hypothetical protein